MKLNFLKKEQRKFLIEGNYHSGQSVEKRFAQIIERIKTYERSGYGEGLASRIQYMIENNIYSLSTPAISNFGKRDEFGSLSPNLPASCNIINIENSIADIYSCNLEAAMLSKRGAGVGVDFDDIADGNTLVDNNFHSNPKIDWIRTLIDTSQKVSQGGVRRGYATPFECITSPDLPDIYKAIDKTNPNQYDVLVDNTIGVKIPDGFMSLLGKGDSVVRKQWVDLLSVRQKSGQAYVSFVENMNKNCSPIYKKLGYSIDRTNICTEFIQPAISGYTPVCVIGAFNLVHWDLITPQMIKDAIYFLNIMNDEYCYLSENEVGLEKAHASARDRRDIGLGTLGFHSLLQSKMLSFGGIGSRQLNKEIYSTIEKYSIEATEELADIFGPCKFAKLAGFNRRNCSLNMIAPNKSSSFFCTIMDTDAPASPGIEPYVSNSFSKKLAKIQYPFRNPYLTQILQELDKDVFSVWESISTNLGSVQHLDFLSDEIKEVFLTANEISPKDMIDLAADRQEYIDMGQSLNLWNRPNYTLKDLNQIHQYAFDKGIKTLYYFYPQAHATLERDGKQWNECISCAD